MDEVWGKIKLQLAVIFPSRKVEEMYHLERVYNLAVAIMEGERKASARCQIANEKVVRYAAGLLDVHEMMVDGVNACLAPKSSLPQINMLLDKLSVYDDWREQVLYCIEHHHDEMTTELIEKGGVELMIVQDAWKLDEMGAMGLVTRLLQAGKREVLMYNPDLPFGAEYARLDKRMPSAIHGLRAVLSSLESYDMLTHVGREMAMSRNCYMNLFLKHFVSEWKGEK